MSDSELIFFGVPVGVVLSALLFWLALPIYQWGTGGHLFYLLPWHFMVMLGSLAFVVAWFLAALLVAVLRRLMASRRRSP